MKDSSALPWHWVRYMEMPEMDYYHVPAKHAEAFRELCEACLKAHDSGNVIDDEAALYLGKTLWREIFEEKK